MSNITYRSPNYTFHSLLTWCSKQIAIEPNWDIKLLVILDIFSRQQQQKYFRYLFLKHCAAYNKDNNEL